ncbi:hypothetical protein [Longitalea luteola]|uniref:hypothetical protein n=1 Tax=Longitalea luteola TaxID=2812563 RepID=UPI001A95A242|nr:hypothetical protein [Longitalea luteola]
MNHFLNRPDIYNQPIRLTNESPQEVIKDFFLNFHLSDVRQELWNMVEAVLTTNHPNYSEGKSRDTLLYFYSQLELLIEAVFIEMNKQPKKE